MRCLDYDRRQRQPGHHRVAHREAPPARRRVRPELRDHGALGCDPSLQGRVLWRIGAVQPRADDRDRSAAGGQRCGVRRGVDSGREPGCDCVPAATRCEAISAAASTPSGAGVRAPTTATAFVSVGFRPPATNISGGRSWTLGGCPDSRDRARSSARCRAPPRLRSRPARFGARSGGRRGTGSPGWRPLGSSSSTASALPASSTRSAYRCHGRSPSRSNATSAALSSVELTVGRA